MSDLNALYNYWLSPCVYALKFTSHMNESHANKTVNSVCCFFSPPQQVVLTLVWMIIEPPGTRYSYPHRQLVILKCNIQNMSFFISQLYNAILIMISTIFAFKTRKIPANFNESKYIGFTMYTTCIIWLAFVPIYYGTGSAHETQITTLCVSISLSATVILVCLYGPKVNIILFHPKKNQRNKVTIGTFKMQSSSAGTSSINKCKWDKTLWFINTLAELWFFHTDLTKLLHSIFQYELSWF